MIFRSRGTRKQKRARSRPVRILPVFYKNGEKEFNEMESLSVDQGVRSKLGDENSPKSEIKEADFRQPRAVDDWAYLKPDEHGAELAREARVWRVYVSETDKVDGELVEGWDKSLDVLLVFAGLFSAILTAFVLESSRMLKQDPADISAATLIVISRALVTPGGNSSENSSSLTSSALIDGANFAPSRNAIMINTLWFLSLGLSVTTAFLSMLAKDWCYSFWANRTGHPQDQAYRRQRKWKLIEHWKMQEFLILLPSMIHLSLLLFSMGLCVYLWDLNSITAIPIICITGAAFIFYAWCTVVASIVEYFPYSTIISRISRSSYMRRLYQVTASSGSFVATIVRCLYLGVTFLYLLLILILKCVAFGLCAAFLALDKGSLQRFANAETNIAERASFWAMMALSPMFTAFSSLLHLCSRLRSRVEHRFKFLELSDELTASLTLCWLIQHCETPSAVDIALQAIAGASPSHPSGPLLLCQAQVQIIQRICRACDSLREPYITSLYTRGLEFLRLRSGLNLGEENNANAEDIAVMVWDLKSKNERQIAELVKDGSFIPSSHNLEAITIGNSAASQSLGLFEQKTRFPAQIFDPITKLLSLDLESKDRLLHPAAARSLANAAALYGASLTISELSPRVVDLCMRYCEKLIREIPEQEANEPIRNLGAGTSLILFILFCRRASVDAVESPSTPGSPMSNQIHTRSRQAISTLINTCIGDETYQNKIFLVGCWEILANPTEYGLQESCEYTDLESWCYNRTYYLMGLCPDPLSLLWSHNNLVRYTLTSVLKATRLVSGISSRFVPDDPALPHLPEPTYAMLLSIACRNVSAPRQLIVCLELLAKVAFPVLNERFLSILYMRNPHQYNLTLLWEMGTSYQSKGNFDGWLISTTQLWLLLHLAEGLDADGKKRLVGELDRVTLLRIESKGLDQVREELEICIAKNYEKEHRNNGCTAQQTSVWNQVSFGLREPPRRRDNQNPLRRVENALSRTNNALLTNIEDADSQGKYRQIYLARVVQLILRSNERRTGGDTQMYGSLRSDELHRLIEIDLGAAAQSPQVLDTSLPLEKVTSGVLAPKEGPYAQDIQEEPRARGGAHRSLDILEEMPSLGHDF